MLLVRYTTGSGLLNVPTTHDYSTHMRVKPGGEVAVSPSGCEAGHGLWLEESS